MQESYGTPIGEDRRSLLPVVLGIAMVVIVIGGLMLWSSRQRQADSPPQDHPYAASILFSELALSQAENFVGGTVTYLEGRVTNTGSQTLADASIQTTFRNSLDEVVDQPVQPLMLVVRREPAIDLGRVSLAPLKPGESRHFRLTYEHISGDWNRAMPELKPVNLKTQ
jgi:hypothetical protein